MRFFLKQLSLGQLQSFFVRAAARDRSGGDEQAKPDAVEIKITLTSATLLLLDRMKRKAADASRGATIERLIINQAGTDRVPRVDEAPDASPKTKTSGEPLASAKYYYQKDGTSRPLDIVVSRHEIFHLTIHEYDGEVADRTFPFTDYHELARVLENTKDPRISSREAQLLLHFFSGSDSLRRVLTPPAPLHGV